MIILKSDSTWKGRVQKMIAIVYIQNVQKRRAIKSELHIIA